MVFYKQAAKAKPHQHYLPAQIPIAIDCQIYEHQNPQLLINLATSVWPEKKKKKEKGKKNKQEEICVM